MGEHGCRRALIGLVRGVGGDPSGGVVIGHGEVRVIHEHTIPGGGLQLAHHVVGPRALVAGRADVHRPVVGVAVGGKALIGVVEEEPVRVLRRLGERDSALWGAVPSGYLGGERQVLVHQHRDAGIRRLERTQTVLLANWKCRRRSSIDHEPTPIHTGRRSCLAPFEPHGSVVARGSAS